MSLDWNIGKCRDHKELTSTDEAASITKAVVFETMAVGIGDITEANWREFYTRSIIFRRLIQAEEFKPSDIKRRIGLTTNVFPKEATSKWLKRIYKEAEYRAASRIKHEDA